MGEFLTALAVTALVMMISAMMCCWLVARRVVRANRVVPDRRSPAPLSWLWSWGTPARLHRRLRRAVQVVAYVMAPFRPPPRGVRRSVAPAELVGIANELVVRAAQLDDRLAAAAALAGPWRGRVFDELGAAVREVEASVMHLERVAITWRAEIEAAARMTEPLPALDVRSRLGALEAAITEVAHAAAGGAARAGGPPQPGPAQSPGG
jgi:hypothetical protein